jgi:hypothetical protein
MTGNRPLKLHGDVPALAHGGGTGFSVQPTPAAPRGPHE